MIVKNEAKVIERCLNSAKPIVDYIVITDTGSTDNTIQVIEEYLKKHSIPGKVFQDSWKNFGENRSDSFKHGMAYFDEKNISKDNLYFLLLDADMMLEVTPEFVKDALKDDSYMVQQKTAEHTYFNLRLLKATKPWECIGVTHEYWQCRQFANQTKIFSLKIKDLNDGGARSDKHERDIRLLTEGLQKEPNNSRYKFYLAQAYRYSAEYKKAIKWYKARIAHGGWNEEVWYSKYMIGESYESLGKWGLALKYYHEAYEFNPERAEPLYKIARYFRTHKQPNLAYIYAKMGSKIPFPKNQILFVAHAVYDYLFDEELSIICYYTRLNGKEGYKAAQRLIEKEGIPEHIRAQAIKNITFYR